MSIPWVKKFKLQKKNLGYTIFKNIEIQNTGIEKYKLQKYQKSYRNIVFQNTEIRIAKKRKYPLQIYKNTMFEVTQNSNIPIISKSPVNKTHSY